ncbi:MAG: DNA mismatch repair endonuclease MutL [Desulfovibrio sp.]|nr:DNA mismatch repair endonuclease MutL [Desulfovibrio sp.]
MSVDSRHIQILSVALRNQIAAGEVVERPASALKELMENSLDAGAKHIDIELENGGQSYIKVQDDGCGIAKDELELAVARHATSKIRKFEDLECLKTMGFRGEALPSIAQVSDFTLTSSFGDEAYSLHIAFGEVGRPTPTVLPCGTKVEIRDLFANIPARLKFLKHATTEFKRAQEIFFRLALNRLDIAFSFSQAQREKFRFLANESLETRLATFWPDLVVSALLPFDFSAEGIRVHGLTSAPDVTQVRNNRILLYVNGRPVSDKRLMAAIREAYRGRLTSRDYPVTVLFVEIAPQCVDVNVHPAKSEVRFQDESAVFRTCVTALRRTIEVSSKAGIDEEFTEKSILQEPDFTSHKRRQPNFADPLDEWVVSRREPEENKIKEYTDAENEWKEEEKKKKEAEPRRAGEKVQKKAEPDLEYLGQIALTYLLFRNSQGDLVIIDQHAAHERVLYERLVHGFSCGSGQGLMIPLQLRLRQSELERYQNLRGTLEKLGFQCGLQGDMLVCSAISPLLTLNDAKEFLREALAGCVDDLDAVFKLMACRGAIKAGQELTKDEVYGLIQVWKETAEKEFCPHGRPTVLRWDSGMLEKAFKRK